MVSPMSRVSGCMNRPRLCRMPMLTVSMIAAPARIGIADRTVRVSAMSPPAQFLITQTCVYKMEGHADGQAKPTQVGAIVSRWAPRPDMQARILETADRLFYGKGIRAIGVDTIAAEIGISKRTLYNHFP